VSVLGIEELVRGRLCVRGEATDPQRDAEAHGELPEHLPLFDALLRAFQQRLRVVAEGEGVVGVHQLGDVGALERVTHSEYVVGELCRR
jgi:hypothetical protein